MGKNRNGGESDEEVIRTTGDLVTSLTKDPTILENIFTLLPNLEKIQTAHERHRSIFNEVLGGAHEKEEELQNARNEVISQVSMVHGMAHLTGKQDPSIPQKLGLVQQQPTSKRSASGNPSIAENFRLAYEGHTIIARASAVKSAKSYEIWICEGDPLVESSWRHHTTSGRVNRIEITGLTPGRLYFFKIRPVGSNGAGPWSNFISMMAI